MVVLRKLGTFEYDTERGRFRNWLLTIAANKVRRSKAASEARSHDFFGCRGGESRSLAETLSDSSHDATEVLENDWRQTLVEEALRQILNDPRTDAESVAVFRAVALENQPVSTVAVRHGMTANNVYQIKNRLLNPHSLHRRATRKWFDAPRQRLTHISYEYERLDNRPVRS